MLTSSNMADNYTRKCLEEAIKSDDFWEVYRILSKLSPRQQYQVITMEAGFSLLHVAASENHLNAMSAALSVLATANMVAVLTSADRKYHTVLDCAVLHNHPKMVKLVLQRLSLPERERLLDVRVSNQTALHHACDKGYTDVLSVIVQHVGRDFIKKLLASKNSKGMTPLECASKKHLFDVERCLLENLGIDRMADLEVVVLQPASNPQNLLQPKAERSLPHKPPTALIFYQTNADIPGFERKNAELEGEAILRAFHSIGIHPLVNRDSRSEGILEIITEIRNEEEHSAFIVVVMGHGEEGLVFDRDLHPLYMQDIVKLLSCDKLINTPKALISQACRGTIRPLKPVVRPSGGERDWDAQAQQEEEPEHSGANGNKSRDQTVRPITLVSPNWLVMQSTLHGFTARRNFFIQELSKHIGNCAREKRELYSIFLTVNSAMRCDFELDQTCEYLSTMCCPFILQKF